MVADIERRIGNTLIGYGNVSHEQLQKALEICEREGRRLADVLDQNQLVSHSTYATVLSFETRIPVIDLAHARPARDALDIISRELAEALVALPLSVEEDYITVAMENPTDVNTVEELERHTGKRIEVCYPYQRDLRTAIKFAYENRWLHYRQYAICDGLEAYRPLEFSNHPVLSGATDVRKQEPANPLELEEYAIEDVKTKLN